MEARQQQKSNVNKHLEKQVEELTKLKNLNTKGQREGHNEKQGTLKIVEGGDTSCYGK